MKNQLTASSARRALRKFAKPQKAKLLTRFFKTGKGQYAEGDIFIGVMVPQTRSVAKEFRNLPLIEIQSLVRSPVHEERLLGLIILTLQYPKATDAEKAKIYSFYLKNKKHINNWDLVDVTTPRIVGAHLLKRDRSILYKLAKSKSLWDRRISIIATAMFITNKDFEDTRKISKLLLYDKHDLIHKAVGWMLREAGKRDLVFLRKFLDEHAHEMPRTMLRYSIEKLSPSERKNYLAKGPSRSTIERPA